jgi:hypothetical protein
LPLFASELEMSNSLVRLEIIVDLAEIKKEEKDDIQGNSQ